MTNLFVKNIDGFWVLPFEGFPVNRCIVDYAFSICLLPKDGEVVIRIGSKFMIIDNGNQSILLPTNPDQLGPAFAVLGKKVSSATVDPRGKLEISFSNSIQIIVDPDPSYEAWTLAGPRGLKLVSIPGGDVAIWQPLN